MSLSSRSTVSGSLIPFLFLRAWSNRRSSSFRSLLWLISRACDRSLLPCGCAAKAERRGRQQAALLVPWLRYRRRILAERRRKIVQMNRRYKRGSLASVMLPFDRRREHKALSHRMSPRADQ